MKLCPLCGGVLDSALFDKTTEPTLPVRRLIEQEHPAWQPSDGLCPACALVYVRRHAYTRSQRPLNAQTFPRTTFPYYHPLEYGLLGLTQRLPHHPAYTGKGVTIAFLDSGYYPHPDLGETVDPGLDIAAIDTDVARIRLALEKRPNRIRQYVNLIEGHEGVGVDAPSLWSDAGNSWHGQMTTVIAAGNGQLSGGLHRGYASQAGLLPIKVGRPSGSIPEEDILGGLRWLLRDDNWQRYGVRVVNVSVGGDYPQPWWENSLCLAVEELTRRGVLVVVAAGNSGQERLLAPAQTPSALTVGGVDDANRRWRSDRPGEVDGLRLYQHSWGQAQVDAWHIQKPEILAPAVWLAGPILPVSPLFRELWVLGRAWEALQNGDGDGARHILDEWHSVVKLTRAIRTASDEAIREALLLRMNPHKWVHRHAQHVDGTSVAAPLVAATAAQMLEANPQLTPAQVKQLLLESALPLRHLPEEQTGHGLLQPGRAVGLALRRHGGALAGLPLSGTSISAESLRKLKIPVRVAVDSSETSDAPIGAVDRLVYLGTYARQARSVSLVGSFNGWQPERLCLEPTRNGWWHGGVRLPPGEQLYRFWVVDGESGGGEWAVDGENPVRAESGFATAHSVIG
ncbi:MAG: S8 family serine peptidase [Caldilineaceae bacterium]|nr:S8 family serine peptidase [Caldilineaceae bacterium]HRJ43168.1 S8 family serine peptidase [Caldilineaceae bacterium]